MTVVFSAVIPRSLIVMAVDSAVTNDFGESREYVEGAKAFWLQGVGCVATWGERTGNKVGEFLFRQGISAQTHSVGDLADLVEQYLTRDYQPREAGLDEVGYHVAGFDRGGNGRLYHIFYGFDRPRREDEREPRYKRCDHSPPGAVTPFVFNGRNDLAEMVVVKLLAEIRSGGDTRYDPNTPKGVVCLADFVLRFAAELTPQVGPPFFIHLISPTNRRLLISNSGFCRLADRWNDQVAPKASQERFAL